MIHTFYSCTEDIQRTVKGNGGPLGGVHEKKKVENHCYKTKCILPVKSIEHLTKKIIKTLSANYIILSALVRQFTVV